MAAGGTFGALILLAMTLAGIVAMTRARARRRSGGGSGERPVDAASERRQAATRATERRLAAYLAGRDAERDAGRYAGRDPAATEDQELENGR